MKRYTYMVGVALACSVLGGCAESALGPLEYDGDAQRERLRTLALMLTTDIVGIDSLDGLVLLESNVYNRPGFSSTCVNTIHAGMADEKGIVTNSASYTLDGEPGRMEAGWVPHSIWTRTELVTSMSSYDIRLRYSDTTLSYGITRLPTITVPGIPDDNVIS